MQDPKTVILLYAGIVFLNTILSAVLWARSRTALHRSVFLLWATTVVSLGSQGGLNQNALATSIGFSFVFFVNAALAALIARISGQHMSLRLFVSMWVCGCALSAAAYGAGLPFVAVSLPVSVAVAAPSLYIGLAALLRHSKSLTFTGKGLVVSALFFVAHNLDFPFLGDKEEFLGVAITIAILIVFALSIFAPAVVLEIVTEQESRVRTEMNVAARIQTEILPREPHVAGLELECYMRPAEAVGGDYYDIINVGDMDWILVGDVTGHGLSSGMVMLMAQSLMSAILHTHKDVTPAQLNFLANQVLFKNLQRLEEDRMMTIVSMCHNRKTGEFVVSGCHDDIYVYRKATDEVEVVEMVDFPFGLGFVEELEFEEFQQNVLYLSPGDVMFIGTDGINEAAERGDHQRSIFGTERLMQHIIDNGDRPLSDLTESLLADLEQFTGGVYHDDITFVIVRSHAEVTA